MRTAKIGIFKVRKSLRQTLENVLNASNWKQHVYGRVFLKPNLCAPKYIPGAVTNPELLFHFVEILRDEVEEVIAGDSNGYNYSCDEAFSKTGVGYAVKKAGGRIMNLSRDEMVEAKNAGTLHLKKVRIPKTLLEVDSIVSVPTMKTHEFTLFSGAIKNLFGCLPDDRRILFHPHLNEVLSDLILILRPSFALMDSTVAMEGNGPSRGNPVMMNLVLASNDLLALDKKAAYIMGINWTEVDHLRFISKSSPSESINIQIIGEKIEEVKRFFVKPYLDLAVKTQLQVYRSYLLTYLCFNTPVFHALNGATKLYRTLTERMIGDKETSKHWSQMN